MSLLQMSTLIPNTKPLIIGHRGAKGLAPENTLPAFRAGIAAGADGVEFDVQRTVDGHLVVFHDDDLKRLAGVDGRIVKSTLAMLRELDVGRHAGPQYAGEVIPTLDEVLDTLPDRLLLEHRGQTLQDAQRRAGGGPGRSHPTP